MKNCPVFAGPGQFFLTFIAKWLSLDPWIDTKAACAELLAHQVMEYPFGKSTDIGISLRLFRKSIPSTLRRVSISV